MVTLYFVLLQSSVHFAYYNELYLSALCSIQEKAVLLDLKKVNNW